MAAMTTLKLFAMTKLFPVFAAQATNTNDAGVSGTNNASNWSIDNFLAGLGTNLSNWGAIIMVVLGFAAIIAASYMLVTGLISHGKKQTSWAIVIILFVVGGAMAFGGWNLIANTMSAGLADTVNDWGNSGSTVLPMLPFMLG